MWFGKQKTNQSSVKLKLDGLHCVSCSLNIDGALEDLPGVNQAETSYAKGQTVVAYNKTQVSVAQLRQTIENLGYQVTVIE
jgi:copper chaperone CopZ